MQMYAEATHGNSAIRKRLCEFYTSFHALVAQKLSDRVTGISADYLAWLVLLSADGIYLQNSIGNPSIILESYLDSTADMLQSFAKK